MKQQVIVIAGSGRSGTTWVQDCIAQANDLRTIFEPLNPNVVPDAAKFSYKYLDASDDNFELKQFMDRVLSGHFRSLWMNYRFRLERLNFLRYGMSSAVYSARVLYRNFKKYRGQGQQGLIVKFIRANLMLPWIVEQYRVKALFVTRHPCAVIASKLKLGGKNWAGESDLKWYRDDIVAVRLILDRFGVNIAESFTAVETLAVIWCIENLLPIYWARDSGYLVTSYEKLLTNKEEEWERIIDKLGLSQVPNLSLLMSPSQQVSQEMHGKAISEGNQAKWRNALTASQIAEIASVLDRFSCSVYNVHEDCSIGI